MKDKLKTLAPPWCKSLATSYSSKTIYAFIVKSFSKINYSNANIYSFPENQFPMGQRQSEAPEDHRPLSKTPVTIFTILEHHIAFVGEFYVAAIKILNQIQPIFASYYDHQHWREKTM
ncbi:MAG: hypothetical protein PBV86_23400 [Delftia lacustris]|uniref:hypothetical protein n=1 Tax=Delftia TaxID=80865 RepID=UPI00259D2476|nr:MULTISPECIES: hypothetical protein [unclassified Delftia]WON86743.1 hypothetical protein OK021_18495 [Delftia sp. UGAL515B_04]